MEVKEFVSSILQELEASLDERIEASNKREFAIEKFVQFDLAVTNISNEEDAKAGKFKAGIQVVGFELGGNEKTSLSQQVMQRVQFNIIIRDKQISEPIEPVLSGDASSLLY